VRPRQEGFTLVELLAVIVILGLIAALAVPRLRMGAVERAKTRSAVARLASVATYARDRAASRRATYALNLDLRSGRYWVSVDDAGTPSDDLGGPPLRGRLPEGTRFADIETSAPRAETDDVARIRFGPEGWADPTAIHIIGPEGEPGTLLIAGLSGRVETYDSRVALSH